MFPELTVIEKAARRIDAHVHCTPVFTSTTINRLCRAEVYFKAENLQKTGSFKARGATNAVFSLDSGAAQKGVATHSSGNHGAALAYAASLRGIPVHVVMPANAPSVKKAAVKGYGARVTFSGPDQASREKVLAGVLDETGASYIHPYNDYRVIAGQATAALELAGQVPGLEALIAPVGGGGLLSGTALVVAAKYPGTAVIGAEPAGADDAYRSLAAGTIIPVEKPETVADGLRTSLGELTFPIIRDHVRAILTVSEEAIIEAMYLFWQRMKLLIEPSAAVPFAALLTRREEVPAQKIGVIISGGNIDLDNLPRPLARTRQ